MLPGYRNEGSMESACQSMPVFFKGLMLTLLLTSLIDMITGGFLMTYLANITALTVLHYQIWRLFTSFLVQSLLSTLFSLLACYFLLVPFEKRYSTPFTFFDLIAQNFLVQFVVSVLSFISYEFGSGMAMSKGMWGVWMVYLWRLMLENPDAQIRVMCLPCTIPQKYYPLYILAFFTLISQSIDPVIFLAAGIGYVEAAYFKGYFFKYPLSFIKFTQKLFPQCWKTHPAYYSVEKCKTELVQVCRLSFGAAEGVGSMMEQPQPQQQQPARPAAALFGARGTVVNPENKQPVSLDDVRDHWARKDEDNSTDSTSGLGGSSRLSEDHNLLN